MFPVFRVREQTSTADEVVGSVSSTTYGKETWVKDACLGYLKVGVTMIKGRWHQRGELWAFKAEDPDSTDLILAQPEWEILDGYWGRCAEIAVDQTLQWEKARFQPSDSVRNGEVIKQGWDHEHCEICGETISVSCQPEGYCGHPEDYFEWEEIWVCERCYGQYVQPHSLGFIPRT